MAFEHDIVYITAKIDVEQPNAPESFGTGFFYNVSLNDGKDSDRLLLISNKHVFKDPRGKLTVSLNRRREDGTPELGNIRTFKQAGFEHLYYAHPNPDVDLACVDVSAIPHTDAFSKFLDYRLLRLIDYKKVAPGSSVIFVGYPRGYYDVINNLPLIRRGSIASMPDVDFNGKGEIVIDAQIFPGSSGSPVFVAWNKEYALLGVVSEAVVSLTTLQNIPTNMRRNRISQILGLGIIVKQRHVQELIDHTAEQFIQGRPSNL